MPSSTSRATAAPAVGGVWPRARTAQWNGDHNLLSEQCEHVERRVGGASERGAHTLLVILHELLRGHETSLRRPGLSRKRSERVLQ